MKSVVGILAISGLALTSGCGGLFSGAGNGSSTAVQTQTAVVQYEYVQPTSVTHEPTFQKYGGAVQTRHQGYSGHNSYQTGTRPQTVVGGSCVPGLGVMQTGTLICPGH